MSAYLLPQPVHILRTTRTPFGRWRGFYQSIDVVDMARWAMEGLLKGADYHGPEEVILGCTLPAGLGQAYVRQSALLAGLSPEVSTCSVNKMCASGLVSHIMAAQNLCTKRVNTPGALRYSIAGGIDNLSRSPYIMARNHPPMGAFSLEDSLIHDGLTSALESNPHSETSSGLSFVRGKRNMTMGQVAQDSAHYFAISRAQQEAYVHQGLHRVKAAYDRGFFASQLCPVTYGGKTLSQDENFLKLKEAIDQFPEKIMKLPPAFSPDGTITAATASALSDGACVSLLMAQDEAARQDIPSLAAIKAWSCVGVQPEHFTWAPVKAVKELTQSLNWSLDSIDIFEVNEAFASVPLIFMQALSVPSEKVNIWGGACTLGHPLGASGARILANAAHQLHQGLGRRAIATLCIGGGEAMAVALELPEICGKK